MILRKNLKNSWIGKTVSLLSISAVAVIVSAPASANPVGSCGFNNYADPFSRGHVTAVNSDSPSYRTRTVARRSERDMNQSTERDMNRNMRRVDRDMGEQGPSNTFEQSVPGPSETPSGSPSIDGTSNQDNPNRIN